jgi:diaminopropionate ammonia-lyase
MAAILDAKATIFVPDVMSMESAECIRSEGATVVRVNAGYDETVRAAAEYAGQATDRQLVQDTAWDGYTTVPGWIVDGYGTLLAEIDAQLGTPPDLIAVPVGVGSLAEAVVRHYRGSSGIGPSILSVEPDSAACLLASLKAGRPITTRTQATVMAGLNCGTVSSSAWKVLEVGCDAAVSVSDEAASRAVADLAALGISSGPSGAASLAGVRAVLSASETSERLKLPSDAVVVLLSTEGTQT